MCTRQRRAALERRRERLRIERDGAVAAAQLERLAVERHRLSASLRSGGIGRRPDPAARGLAARAAASRRVAGAAGAASPASAVGALFHRVRRLRRRRVRVAAEQRALGVLEPGGRALGERLELGVVLGVVVEPVDDVEARIGKQLLERRAAQLFVDLRVHERAEVRLGRQAVDRRQFGRRRIGLGGRLRLRGRRARASRLRRDQRVRKRFAILRHRLLRTARGPWDA